MDFHRLSRKELQSLCKQNKIPANMTNVAMADALKALEKVEGLDEFINALKSDSQQSTEKTMPESPVISRTGCRTSTRRKTASIEPESIQSLTRTRRSTRAIAQEADLENRNVILPETPAMPATRRRAPVASARSKKTTQAMESEKDDKLVVQDQSDVETPAARSCVRRVPAVSARGKKEGQDEKSVQRAYSTRRSVRLLEKSMSGLNLNEREAVEPVKMDGLCEEIDNVEKKNASREDLTTVMEESLATDDRTEVHSCQNVDQPPENESEMRSHLQQENSCNDYAVDDCNVMLEIGCEKCDDLDDLSALAAVGAHNNKSLHEQDLQLENSDKAVDVNHESVDENGLEPLDAVGEDNVKSSDEPEIQVESSGKAVDENHDSVDENGLLDLKSKKSEGVNATLKKSVTVEVPDNSYIMETEHDSIDEALDDFSHEAINQVLAAKFPSPSLGGHISVKLEESMSVDSLTAEASEVGDCSDYHDLQPNYNNEEKCDGSEMIQMNATEDEQQVNHDLNFDYEEERDGYESYEVKEAVQKMVSFLPENLAYEGNEPGIQKSIPEFEKYEDVSDFLVTEAYAASDLLDCNVMASSKDISVEDVTEALVDIDVIEALEFDKNPEYVEFHAQVSDREVKDSTPLPEKQECINPGTLVDVHVMPEVDFAMDAYEWPRALEKTPTSAKQTNSCQQLASGSEVSFASDTLQGQFPRPTASTPSKSSAKKHITTIQKMTIVASDINKENTDNSGKILEPKKDKMTKKIMNEEISEDTSLRKLKKLTKMFEEKLRIAKNNEEKDLTKVGKSRHALQTLPENCMAVAESQNIE